jgi:hypothetical protein
MLLLQEEQKKRSRAKRFGLPPTTEEEEERKRARAARFGSSVPSAGATAGGSSIAKGKGKPLVQPLDEEAKKKLNERAKRFGIETASTWHDKLKVTLNVFRCLCGGGALWCHAAFLP